MKAIVPLTSLAIGTLSFDPGIAIQATEEQAANLIAVGFARAAKEHEAPVHCVESSLKAGALVPAKKARKAKGEAEKSDDETGEGGNSNSEGGENVRAGAGDQTGGQPRGSLATVTPASGPPSTEGQGLTTASLTGNAQQTAPGIGMVPGLTNAALTGNQPPQTATQKGDQSKTDASKTPAKSNKGAADSSKPASPRKSTK